MPKTLPVLPITCNASEFAEVYARTRAVLLRGGGEHAERRFGLEELRRLPAHSELLRDAGETFTVENAPIRVAEFVDGRGKRKHAPEDATAAVFGPRTASELLDSACALPGAWYASCVLGREPAAIDALLRAVPLAVPPSLADAHARHSRAVCRGRLPVSHPTLCGAGAAPPRRRGPPAVVHGFKANHANHADRR
jgi:hypothetical protein